MVSKDLFVAVAIFFLVAALFFLTFFSGLLRRPSVVPRSTTASANIDRPPTGAIFFTGQTRGLDPSAIESFPKFSYSSVKPFSIGNGALDCYVCLNEFEDAETLRLIPACDHVFHARCIDTWLAFNGTCPVCRAILAHAPELTPTETGNRNQDEEVVRPPIRTSSMGRRREMMERFTLRLPEEVRRRIIVSGKLRRAANWDPSPKAAAGISRRERGGSYKEESRLRRWLSVAVSPRLVSGSISMESEPAVTEGSGHGGTMDLLVEE